MKCLIVVDFQTDFVTGSLGFPKAKTLEDKIYQKIMTYQNNQDDVVFTLDTHGQEYLGTQEGKRLPVIHCQEYSEGWELFGRMKDIDGYRIYKTTFGAEPLFAFLKNRQYDSIELVGLVTNICVIANAVLAKTALPDVPIIIDAHATASYDEDLHEKALDVMAGLQMDIINRGV